MHFSLPLCDSRWSLLDKKKKGTNNNKKSPPQHLPPCQLEPREGSFFTAVWHSGTKKAQHFENRKLGITGIFQCVKCKRNMQSLHLPCKQCHSSCYFARMVFLKPKIQRYRHRGKKKLMRVIQSQHVALLRATYWLDHKEYLHSKIEK